MNWCKLIGHKWDYYNEKLPYTDCIKINTYFRYCAKCHTKQIRNNYTGYEDTDWKNYQLNVEQLRDKKLKELGI